MSEVYKILSVGKESVVVAPTREDGTVLKSGAIVVAKNKKTIAEPGMSARIGIPIWRESLLGLAAVAFPVAAAFAGCLCAPALARLLRTSPTENFKAASAAVFLAAASAAVFAFARKWKRRENFAVIETF